MISLQVNPFLARRCRAALVVPVIFVASVCHATDVVTTWDHSGDGKASGEGADVSVHEHDPAAAEGSSDRLFVRFDSDVAQQRNSFAALRFDISEMSDASSGQAYALELYDLRFEGTSSHQASGKSFSLWLLTDETQADWEETSATWQSGFPGQADDATAFNGPDFTEAVTLLESFTFRASGNEGWLQPVTLSDASMQTIAALQTTTLTFYLTANEEIGTQYRFASKENSDAGMGSLAPRLSLQTAPAAIAEDFGWRTRGGYGGQVIKVTNLEASGPGSFREALETSGPRIIVFEVGGVIDMGGNFEAPNWAVTEPYLTVAGQTAPSPGITLIRGGINVQTHDVIFQHLRIRPGDAGFDKRSGWEPDALSASGPNAYNVIFDHITATWATDEGMSASGARNVEPYETSHNVTLSHCLIAENLNDSTHANGLHSKGSLIHDHVRGIAILGCLYASNRDRNPYFKAETTGIFANNVVYNPGVRAIQYGYTARELNQPPEPAHFTVVGNHYRQGPNTTSGLAFVTVTDSRVGDIYLNDNIAETPAGNPLPIMSGSIPQLNQPVVWPGGFVAMPAAEVWDYVLANAGARPLEPNAIDDRIRASVHNNTGAIIDSQEEVGGYPSLTPTSHTLTVPDGADEVDAWLRAWSAIWEPTSKQAFLAQHFSITERWIAGSSGDLADPERDGMPNLLEYALALDPHTFDEGQPLLLDYQSSADRDVAWLQFRNRIDMAQVSIALESSTNLHTWSSVIANGTSVVESIINPDVDGDGRAELRRFEFMQPIPEPTFYRLRVSN